MHLSAPHAPILIVDDDAAQRSLTRLLLGVTDLSGPIIECVGGPESLSYLQSCQQDERPAPAAVFLDLAMPTIDGIGVLKWIRANPYFFGLKIVILTSSTSAADREVCAALGADAYLVKHPAPELLRRTLATLGLPQEALTHLKSA